jgi:hypothetical protein
LFTLSHNIVRKISIGIIRGEFKDIVQKIKRIITGKVKKMYFVTFFYNQHRKPLLERPSKVPVTPCHVFCTSPENLELPLQDGKEGKGQGSEVGYKAFTSSRS